MKIYSISASFDTDYETHKVELKVNHYTHEAIETPNSYVLQLNDSPVAIKKKANFEKILDDRIDLQIWYTDKEREKEYEMRLINYMLEQKEKEKKTLFNQITELKLYWNYNFENVLERK